MTGPRHPYRELGEIVRKAIRDPKDAAEYLNAAVEDGDHAGFLVALRDVLEVHGSLAGLSRSTGLNRANLHKMLQGKSSPRLDTLTRLLDSVGLRITIQPARNTPARRRAAPSPSLRNKRLAVLA